MDIAQTTTELTTMSVESFMGDQGFISVIQTVRENLNGYPFVTFMDADNKAENVYFSKAASEDVAAGDSIARGFFDPYVMVLTANADGEARWKIATKGGSNRLEVADLF
jgi:hypothetical protein